MFLISHRGNITGTQPDRENTPEFINEAVVRGFDVEIDVWYKGDQLFLGHDYPQHKVGKEYIKNNKFWCHAKNLEALEYLINNNIRCFWHQEDDFTLTTDNFIWTYPKKMVCKKSIIVCNSLEESEKYVNTEISGICSDYVGLI